MVGLVLVLFLSSGLVDGGPDSSVVVGHESVQVTAGDDVILSCLLEPPFDVTDLTVEWTWNGLNVHVYRHRKDDHDLQDEHFRGRTSLFHHEMTKGNISLKLTNVTEDDAGLYICYVPRLDSQVKKGKVLLRVNPQKDPEGGDNETEDDNEPTKDAQTGVIGGSVVGALLLIIAASAVISYFVNKKTGFITQRIRRRRDGNNQEDDQQREQPDTEVQIPLNSVNNP